MKNGDPKFTVLVSISDLPSGGCRRIIAQEVEVEVDQAGESVDAVIAAPRPPLAGASR